MEKRELWDAYDQNGNKLGFDLVRDEEIPSGAWHLVAEIYALTTDGQILVTRRHPDKSWGGYWEITGGAVLKGESPTEGAVRELREETGITAAESDLHPVYVQARPGIDGYPSIYHSFMVFFDEKSQNIRLQEGETSEYRLLPYAEYKRFIQTDAFVPRIRDRFLDHEAAFDALAAEHFKSKSKRE